MEHFATSAEVIYGQPDKSAVAVKHAARIHSFVARIAASVAPKSVLEIGSGEGIVGAAIAANHVKYVGIEPDHRSLSQAKANFPALTFIHASTGNSPQDLALGTFDLVLSNDVIEHVYDPRKFVAFAKAHLRPGGHFVCGTPNYGSYTRNLLIALAGRWDQHHTALWDGGHIKFFSKRTLGHLLSEGGFCVERWETLSSSRIPFLSSALFAVARLL
jgi:2-polyprenyl-6-hydroxyphenyl methylase/3-demethylubiquinone-9 3-methyltransferase